MSAFVRACVLLSLTSLSACAPSPPAQPPFEERSSGQVVVAWLHTDPTERWWLEESLAPWPEFAGDRDLGPRRIMRATPDQPAQAIWSSASPDRLTAATVHPQGDWSAVGVDGLRRPFLLRGDLHGVRARIVLDDPALPGDPAAWLGSAPSELRVGLLSEDSVRIGGSAEDLTVTLMSEHNAVLAYRWHWDGAAWQRGPRTLISPAYAAVPFLPIGATYDSFDAITNPFSAPMSVAPDGSLYIAFAATPSRLTRHNARFGTRFEPLRSADHLGERPTDILLTRVAPDGTILWSRLVGTPDVDDELYAVATGSNGQVALAGRARRELGLDNSEWHATITTLDASGVVTAAILFDTADSGIAQCATFAPDGSLYVGGTEAWAQNPEGFSLYQNGRPFLLRVGAAAIRQDSLLPTTEGHAELRALATSAGHLWMGGLERGPLTHTGDRDRSLIRADGWRSSAELP